jgi:hypothetical protein
MKNFDRSQKDKGIETVSSIIIENEKQNNDINHKHKFNILNLRSLN